MKKSKYKVYYNEVINNLVIYCDGQTCWNYIDDSYCCSYLFNPDDFIYIGEL